MAALVESLRSVVMDARWCDGVARRCFAPHGGWVVPRGANTRRRAAGDCGGAVRDCGEGRSEARKMAGTQARSQATSQATPRFMGGPKVESGKKLSDADAPFGEAAVELECASAWDTGRSRWSINQRATAAEEFSSSHWSISAPISLRRLAAWLRRVSS
jgi:hypothetical protein